MLDKIVDRVRRFRNSRESERFPTDDQWMYGPLSPDLYPEYAKANLIKKIDEPDEITARRNMFENYQKLINLFSTHYHGDAVASAYEAVMAISPFAKKELTRKDKKDLAFHLEEIQQFADTLLLNEDGSSRFSDFLTDEEAQLMVYVIAPMHDVLKYLGEPKAQIMPDHEIMTAEFVRTQFLGKTVKLGADKELLLNQSHVDFIASVIGDHENIDKEDGRVNYIHSKHSAERGKAVFFVLDVLTNAVSIHGNRWSLVEHELDDRYSDLIYRQIQVDPAKGKTYRPIWAEKSTKDLETTLITLMNSLGLTFVSDVGDSLRETLVRHARIGIARALRGNSENRIRFSQQQIEEIKQVDTRLVNYYLTE